MGRRVKPVKRLRARTSAPAPRDGEGVEFRSLAAVEQAVVNCTRCPRLRTHCEQVGREKRRAFRDQVYWTRPVPAFGDSGARLLVVGLAPAAHGANRTGRMFTGDSSGDWLYEALHRYGFASQPQSTSRRDGLRLEDCLITAAARCAPPDNRPTPAELERCRVYLTSELRHLPSLQVVLVLGRIAHDAWLRASGWWTKLAASDRPRFAHGAETALRGGPVLLSSYHPSRQNTQTGRLTRPMWHAVFRRARALVDASPTPPLR